MPIEKNNSYVKEMTTNFHVLNWNVQGLSNKINEIEYLISTHCLDVISITEHWLDVYTLSTFLLSDFTLANTYCRNVYNRGSVAIFVRNGLEYKSLDFVNKLSIETICEASAVLIEKFKIIVLSIYRTPKYENFHQFFLCIAKYF